MFFFIFLYYINMDVCNICLGEGFIIKTEWADEDRDYEVEVPCVCNQD